MKKTLLIAVVVTAAMVSGGAVYAHMADGQWGHGPGACMSGTGQTGGNVNVENFKKFQKETLSLRDELVIKRVELGNEYNAETPDETRVAELKKEIADLQTKIRQSADKYGVAGSGPGPGRGPGRGMMCANGPDACPMCKW